MATSNDNDIESGDEVSRGHSPIINHFALHSSNSKSQRQLFEDALEVQSSTANGHCEAKRMPVANPDAFEFLLPLILGKGNNE